MSSFEEILKKRPITTFIKGKRRVVKPKGKGPNAQGQKYALVPQWRRRRAGKTGQKV